MQAVSLISNGQLRVEQREVPEPSAEHVIVCPTSSGICSSDFPRVFESGAYHYPLVIGHEFSGYVYDSGGSGWSQGDRVAVFPLIPCKSCSACIRSDFQLCASYDYLGSRSDGGMSQYVSVPAWNLLKVPEGIEDQDAALVEPLAVVVRALRRLTDSAATVATGQNVAVLGAGFLGQLALRVLRLADRSIATTILDRNRYKLEIAQSVTSRTIEVGSTSDQPIQGGSFDNTFDLVLEASGASANLTRALTLVRPGGRVVLLGNPHSDAELSHASLKAALRKEAAILGSWNSSFNQQGRQDDWKHAMALLSAGLRPSELVSHTLNMGNLTTGFSRLHSDRAFREQTQFLKAVVEIS